MCASGVRFRGHLPDLVRLNVVIAAASLPKVVLHGGRRSLLGASGHLRLLFLQLL